MSHQNHHSHPQNHRGGVGGSNRVPGQSSVSSNSPSSQSYLSTCTPINENWHSDKDFRYRREMVQNIEQLLKEPKQNSFNEWLLKLPQMVKQLEVSLYNSAPSFEAYVDKSTLQQRLQVLAMKIATQNHRDGGGSNKVPGQSSVSSNSPPSQSYLSAPMNGNWHNDKHFSYRTEMVQNIEQLLKEREENSFNEWLFKLPQMVHRIEVSLYNSAPSFEAYVDKSTLRQRLQVIVTKIAAQTA